MRLVLFLFFTICRPTKYTLSHTLFPSTSRCLFLVGATPVFVDIDATTFNMDPASLAAAIAMVVSAGKLRPAGVIPVDLFGQPADYDAIEDLAAAHGLRSEEHTSELQSLMRISYAVFFLKKKIRKDFNLLYT